MWQDGDREENEGIGEKKKWMKEIERRKKTTSRDVHEAGNVNLEARSCREWMLSELSGEQTNENISKANIFTDSVAQQLVNLLMQHRSSFGNSV